MTHVKVLFVIEKDEDNYPPVDVEGVWAEQQENGVCKLDNIPLFTRQATLGDIVEVRAAGDELFYETTLERSGNSLLRVAFFGGYDPSSLRSNLAKLGCSTEQISIPSLISVDVPPTVEIEKVRAVLDDGLHKGFWDYEEPILRH